MEDQAVGTLTKVIRTWRLDTPAQTLVLCSRHQRLPVIVYWGPSIGDEDLAALAQALHPPRTPAILDIDVEVSLCPESGRAFPGQPGLAGRRANGTGSLTQFRLEDARSGVNSIQFLASDVSRGLNLTCDIAADPETDMLSLKTNVTNIRDTDYHLDWLAAPALPLDPLAATITDFTGRWTQEFTPQRHAIQQGQHSRISRRGRNGHDHFPGWLIENEGVGEHAGTVRAVHLAWSGNHKLFAERLPDARGQFQAGALLDSGEVILAPGETFETPVLLATLSDEGRNGVLHAFHRHMRRLVAIPDRRHVRKVHFNCWEAVYLNHDMTTLKELATRAAALGAERYVLDDGWFLGRTDDERALGDWTVDPAKYPDDLTPLINHIHAEGMDFGLWVEPEMVNPDSDLARAHPDWLMRPDDFDPILGRSQNVLNLTNPDVFSYLYEALNGLLTTYPIHYLKWDMNRDLALAIDREGRPLVHRQTLALYALLDRIGAEHPDVEIESCASGGGRIDAGILKRTERVWLSDSNDALVRARMQHQAMLFLPPEIVGSHVGPTVCHTSGRVLPMGLRAGVAMAGHMGIEADVRALSENEFERLAGAIDIYKANRDWMHRGRSYRLETHDDHRIAHMVVDDDRQKLIMFTTHLDVDPRTAGKPLALAGLDQDRNYRLRLQNAHDIDPVACRVYVSPIQSAEGLVLSGATLMRAGIVLPNACPDTVWIVTGEPASETRKE